MRVALDLTIVRPPPSGKTLICMSRCSASVAAMSSNPTPEIVASLAKNLAHGQ
jgi:hypothetical protein